MFEALSVTLACSSGLAASQTHRCILVLFLWQVLNQWNILFTQLKLVTTKRSVQNSLFLLHLVMTLLIYVDNDAKNVTVVCFHPVYMWNSYSHSCAHQPSEIFSLPILACELPLFLILPYLSMHYFSTSICHTSQALVVFCAGVVVALLRIYAKDMRMTLVSQRGSSCSAILWQTLQMTRGQWSGDLRVVGLSAGSWTSLLVAWSLFEMRSILR